MQYALSSVIIFDMYNRIWHQQHNIIFGSRSTKLQKEIILRNILKNKKFDSTQCFNVQSFAFSVRNTHNQPFKCDYVQIIENLLLPGKNMHNMHIYIYQQSKIETSFYIHFRSRYHFIQFHQTHLCWQDRYAYIAQFIIKYSISNIMTIQFEGSTEEDYCTFQYI